MLLIFMPDHDTLKIGRVRAEIALVLKVPLMAFIVRSYPAGMESGKFTKFAFERIRFPGNVLFLFIQILHNQDRQKKKK